MKKRMSIILCGAVAFSFVGCGKKAELNPEDTTLIKSDGRPGFSGPGGTGGEDIFAAGGEGIDAGFGGEDVLAPLDAGFAGFADVANVDTPFEPVYFGFDQYSVGSAERTKLQQVAEYLQINGDARILIEGHCDWKGTPAYNKSLGDRRATSVKNYLVDMGGDPARIEVLSLGDEQATPNADSLQAGMERKARILVLKDS